jgi:hypothetical protein
VSVVLIVALVAVAIAAAVGFLLCWWELGTQRAELAALTDEVARLRVTS